MAEKRLVAKMMDLSRFNTASLEAKYELVDSKDSKAKNAEGLITFGTLGPSAKQLEEFPEVKIICVLGVGFETVDIAAAKKKNVIVTNGKGTNSNAVADHALALTLAIARNVCAKDQEIRHGEFKPAKRPQLAEMNVGIFGLGSIGEKIAQRITAFDAKVFYFNRKKRSDLTYTYVESLEALAAESDYLIIAAPGGSETKHHVNAKVLKALGPDGFLINISRGSVVDTDALIAALKAGTIAGAALDVLESEPEVPKELSALKNVVITPHMAGMSPQSFESMIAQCEKNLDAFFSGRPLIGQIS